MEAAEAPAAGWNIQREQLADGDAATSEAPDTATAMVPERTDGADSDDEMFDPTKHGAALATGPETVDAKQAATSLQPRLEEAAQSARVARQPLAAELAEVEQRLEGAAGDEKAELEARKNAISAKLGPLDTQIKQTEVDLAALRDPALTPAKSNEILARQNAYVKTDTTVEVDNHDSDLEKKRTENKKTTVTSSYDKGQAATDTHEETAKVGLGGYNKAKTDRHDVVGADGSKASTISGTATNLGPSGVSYEKSKADSAETADGKKSGTSSKTSVNVGPGGASYGTTRTETNGEEEKTKASKVGIERGEGKLGVAADLSSGTKNAAGESKNSGSIKGGVVAGKDGTGVFGAAEGKHENTTTGGFKTGAVAGLTGGATCNVTEVKGTDPVQYDIVISITLGAKAGLSTGYGKEGGAGKAGVSVSGEASGTFTRSHRMTAAEATAYVERLKASNGGSAAGPEKEMAVLAALAARGQDAAREVAEGAKAAAGSAEALEKMAEGDKVGVSTEVKGGAAGKASVGGFGGEAGYETSHTNEVSIEKKGDGKVEYGKKVGDADKGSLGATASIGVVEGGIGFSRTSKSAHGYKFLLDPKDPHFDAGSPQFVAGYASVVAELGAANTQAALDAFAAKYGWTVTERSEVKGEGSGDKASVGIGPVKAGMTSNASIEEETTRDAAGNVTGKTVTGTSGGGASVEAPLIGSVSGSVQDTAVAKIDGEGHASLDVSETVKETDAAKKLGAVVPFSGADKPQKSTLQKVTGGGEKPDTDTTHVEGIGANGGDLAALAWAAAHGEWMKHCPKPRLRDDWAEAGREVVAGGCTEAACATALAKFVGKGGPGREEVVDEAIRYGTGGGSRYEFPEGLGHLRAPYAELTGNLAAKIDAVVGKEGAAKGIETAKVLMSRIDSMQAEIRNNQAKFENVSRYGEMIDTLTKRKTEVEGKVRTLNGGKPDELTHEEWKARYNQLLSDCTDFKNQESNFFEKMNDAYKPGALDKLFGSDGSASLGETIEIEKYRSQLRELYARWNPKYAEMAGIAQEHDFGKDIYWKYKPDNARWQRASGGKPGAATEAQRESRDLKKKKETIVRAPADPVGDGAREVKKMQAASASGIQAQVPNARNRAAGAGNRLYKKIQGNGIALAIDAHNRGMKKLNSANKTFARIPKNASEDDWNSYGYIALEDFNAAKACFDEGLAKY